MVVGRQVDALQHRQINDFLHGFDHLIIGRAGLGQAAVGQVKSSGRLIEAVVDHQLAPLHEEDVTARLAGDAAGGEVLIHRFYAVGHLAALLAELDAPSAPNVRLRPTRVASIPMAALHRQWPG